MPTGRPLPFRHHAGGTEGDGGATAALVLAGLAAGAVAVGTARKRAA